MLAGVQCRDRRGARRWGAAAAAERRQGVAAWLEGPALLLVHGGCTPAGAPAARLLAPRSERWLPCASAAW